MSNSTSIDGARTLDQMRLRLLQELSHYCINVGLYLVFSVPFQEPTLLDLAHQPLPVTAVASFNVAEVLQNLMEIYGKAIGVTAALLRLLENDRCDNYD